MSIRKRYSTKNKYSRSSNYRPSFNSRNSVSGYRKRFSIGKWFSETFPPVNQCSSVIRSSRFWLIAGAAAAVFLIILFMLIIPGLSATETVTPEQPETAAETAEADEQPPEMNLYNGYEGEEIPQLQERLGELGYLELDETTNLYGPTTEVAVSRFQLLNGLEQTGCVKQGDWDTIFSDEAVKSVVSAGMEGDDIKDYQTRLSELGFLNADSTGYYGTDTSQAVYDFQLKNWIATTGVINEATSEKLYASDVVPKYLGVGMTGDAVVEVQTRLIQLGYLTGAADGDYGERTQIAVKLFQKKNGLVVDGYLGTQTKSLLMSEDAQPNAYSVGDQGEAVTAFQDRLVQLNYINKSTGYFGSDTKEAVQNFQKANGLEADGKAGYYTLSKMYADDVVYSDKPLRVGYNSGVNAFIEAAKSKLGCKYVLGAKGSEKFDCSGLVYWCLNKAGVSQGYITSTTWRNYGSYKKIKSIDDVRAGDVICFRPHHVGIAISSEYMIDASTNNGKVVCRSFKSSYFRRNFVCARRIF